jgi:hypothetical protein
MTGPYSSFLSSKLPHPATWDVSVNSGDWRNPYIPTLNQGEKSSLLKFILTETGGDNTSRNLCKAGRTGLPAVIGAEAYECGRFRLAASAVPVRASRGAESDCHQVRFETAPVSNRLQRCDRLSTRVHRNASCGAIVHNTGVLSLRRYHHGPVLPLAAWILLTVYECGT